MQNATTIIKNLHEKMDNLLEEKHKHELKAIQLDRLFRQAILLDQQNSVSSQGHDAPSGDISK